MTPEPNDAVDPVVQAFEQGELIVYATEAVMGIGCDPDNEDAVMRLLKAKQRPVDKGLILVAANYSQLLPYCDDNAIPQEKRAEIFSSWPGPHTWLMPKSSQAPAWISGQHDSIAMRVTAFEPLADLCRKIGKPIVSTSANLSGQEPARTLAEAQRQLGDGIFYVDGDVQGLSSPSTIKDALTGKVIRS
ncbi:L-threonylcarbamoyladenylate synthase type 1 TsaC [Alteromonas sediminis]|uniref:Threonylcarbamoyl-AMP synthase n=1 Tax=Alteromonas sediminis TaxID=2259342 RepID=A0A3N5Y1F9_9ALTE|nr:Sua5/YciO/YrdC/YwlC family protein [Alteromonas sediminis]RPJ66803.1 L-threonylcarbamoyladenylate synthase type 1 TsaC [Alteromonas sediminis]